MESIRKLSLKGIVTNVFNNYLVRATFSVFLAMAFMYTAFYITAELCIQLTASYELDIKQVVIVAFLLFLISRYYGRLVELYKNFNNTEIPAFACWITTVIFSFKPVSTVLLNNDILDSNYIAALKSIYPVIAIYILFKIIIQLMFSDGLFHYIKRKIKRMSNEKYFT